ncbi:MAG: hypothetical protein ACP5O3_04480 [Candidatus Micrarchaeia archaeon]
MKTQTPHTKNKAFIGPLGDDIPSIFPIVLGILIFMGTLIYVNNALTARNDEFNLRRAALSLGYLATQKGAYTLDEFKTLCITRLTPFANQQGINFAVVMKRHCNKIDLFGTNPFFSGYNSPRSAQPDPGLCTNDANLANQISTTDNSYEIAKASFPNNTIVYNYPVSVPCPEANSSTQGLGIMNVIAWPKTKNK